jgi:hypothetical protein
MPSFIFLNPVYLGALALGALPILIHLIRRRKVKIVPWAAWDFLLQSTKRNRRRLRLEQLILLLLRIAIVCLVVLAFCRPLLRSLGLPLVAANERVHALIVLDNSYSMGYRRDGVTDFDRAKLVADNLLARVLKQGDSVSLVLLSSKPEAHIKQPSFDLSKARERVRSARLSDRDTDYGTAAALCSTLLKDVRATTKEVYWITDSQRSGFPDATRERAQAACKELARTARLTWINVATGTRDNLCLEAPVFSRELVTPQAPVRIEATVRNYSPSPRNSLLVNLNVDGRAAGSARVDVPANGTAKASFLYLFEKPGVQTGTLSLSQPDGLGRDNASSFAAKVRDNLRVLIVNPTPNSDPAKDEAFYLATALAPVGATQGGSTAIQPTVHSGAQLTNLDLRAYDAVVITGLNDMDGPSRSALQEFVSNGGGLMLFPGPNTDPAHLNATLGSGERFLPARLGPRRQLSEEAAVTLNPATITHPALATFRNTSEINLGSARVTLLYDLQVPPGDEAVKVLCRFSGGQPAYVERRYGQGKVILVANPAGTSGGNLPYKPAFVPLVHQIVAYLAAGPTSQRNVYVGDPLDTRFDIKEAGKAVRLTDPAGQTSLHKSTLSANGVVFHHPTASKAGVYKIGLADKGTTDAFAVNLPAGESDLSSATDQQVQAAVGGAQMQFARGTDDLMAVVRQSRRGTEVWRTLLYAAVFLLFLEGVLAWQFGRRT